MSIYLLIYIKRNTGRINQKQDEMKLLTGVNEIGGKVTNLIYFRNHVKCFIYTKNYVWKKRNSNIKQKQWIKLNFN